MRYSLLILVAILCDSAFCKDVKQAARSAPSSEAKDQEQSVTLDVVFSLELASIESNYIDEKSQVYESFRELQQSDPEVALNIAKLWFTKSYVALSQYSDSESRKSIDKAGRRPDDSKSIIDEYRRCMDSATTAYFFDHIEEISKMISIRISNAKSKHADQERRVQQMIDSQKREENSQATH